MRFKKGDIITLLRPRNNWAPYQTIYRIDDVRKDGYFLHHIKSEAWRYMEGKTEWWNTNGDDFDEYWGLDPRYGINALLKQYYGSDTGKL